MYTILNRNYRFWNGYKFVAEFPDAKAFKSLAEAKATCSVISRREPAQITYDYGLDTETVVYDTEKLVAPPQEH